MKRLLVFSLFCLVTLLNSFSEVNVIEKGCTIKENFTAIQYVIGDNFHEATKGSKIIISKKPYSNDILVEMYDDDGVVFKHLYNGLMLVEVKFEGEDKSTYLISSQEYVYLGLVYNYKSKEYILTLDRVEIK